MKKIFKYGILSFGSIILIGFLVKGHITYEPFDSEKWKNWIETEETWFLRWDMMNSLRHSHNLKGKTKMEIIELLGEPESKINNNFYYHLGAARRGIDIGTLTIKFDETEKVIEFKVWRG
ncbi:hypothetical protein [Sphingobacterium corticibacterium]|uniref:Uncharacterized protein n=1 Tax=Sphingobacterium corticibacterium TaxID=2484746 RepID=A0A4Q6XQ17_9SPHI|nr:hypothetical protein [Sphingobacterium corticibacterium]RZF62340.1 hypothetical protein EWE74_05940 [Sphingobacterium corticibacterium]